MNYFKRRKLFNTYKKNLIKNKDFLLKKYGLEINIWYDLYSTYNFADAPEDLIKKLDFSFKETELKKYFNFINKDLEKIDLSEICILKEIIKIDEYNYGISYGYSLCNDNKRFKILNTIIDLSITGLAIFLGFLVF